MIIARYKIIGIIEGLGNKPGTKYSLDCGRYVLTGIRRKNGWDIRFKDVQIDNSKKLYKKSEA